MRTDLGNLMQSMSDTQEHIQLALADWIPGGGTSVTSAPDGSLLFNEGTGDGFHLIGVSSPLFATLVRLSILVVPVDGCDAEIYINHWGGIDVCRIAPSGSILDQPGALKLSVEHHDDGALEIVVEYRNSHEMILLGTSRGAGGRYLGGGRDQLRFKAIEITLLHDQITLADWVPGGGTSVRSAPDGSLLFNEGTGDAFHLIGVRRRSFATLVRLRILVVPVDDCDAEIYVNHWGGIDICRIAPSGTILDQSGALKLSVEHHDDGTLDIVVEYHNLHEMILLGTSRGAGGRYLGGGRDQLRFKAIEITLLHDQITPNRQITLIDVGAMGGLQREWAMLPRYVRPVLFEPNPVEAANLRRQIASFAGAKVIETALYNTAGSRPLYITRGPGCCSLLLPNFDVVNRYTAAPIFEVLRQVDVECKRYDQLYEAGLAPMPDVIKIDVQGAEYEVLQGFGRLLESCLGIELETHVYQLYKEQKLLCDIVKFLDSFDFSLRSLREQHNTDGDSVEFNAFFTKRREKLPSPREGAAEKLTLIERVWGLKVYDGGQYLVRSLAWMSS
jgi:FkbM family methyltransferase